MMKFYTHIVINASNAINNSLFRGSKPKFSVEQVVQIVAIAWEDPGLCERPVTHWTPRELADEAVKRGIVEQISARSVGRFFKRGYPQTSS